MTRHRIGWLTFHAAAVILGAGICGVPYNEAIKASKGMSQWFSVPGTPAMWHLAHMEGLLNGILVLAAAGVMARLQMSDRAQRIALWSLAFTVWGNFIGSVLAAVGNDTTVTLGFTNNPAAFVAFDVAVVGIGTATVLLICVGLGNVRRGRSSHEVRSTAE